MKRKSKLDNVLLKSAYIFIKTRPFNNFFSLKSENSKPSKRLAVSVFIIIMLHIFRLKAHSIAFISLLFSTFYGIMFYELDNKLFQKRRQFPDSPKYTGAVFFCAFVFKNFNKAIIAYFLIKKNHAFFSKGFFFISAPEGQDLPCKLVFQGGNYPPSCFPISLRHAPLSSCSSFVRLPLLHRRLIPRWQANALSSLSVCRRWSPALAQFGSRKRKSHHLKTSV